MAIGAALAAMAVAPAAMAGHSGDHGNHNGNGGHGNHNGNGDRGGYNRSDDPSGDGEDIDLYTNKIIHTTVDVHFRDPNIDLDGLAEADTNTEQNQSGNYKLNDRNANNAKIGGNALQNADGNVGANVAAGDYNNQANSTSIAAIDADFVFMSGAEAQGFVEQHATDNETANFGLHNNASVSGHAFSGASGNVGVNVVSGTNNGQQNSLSIAKGTGAMAIATASTEQESTGNNTGNEPALQYDPECGCGAYTAAGNTRLSGTSGVISYDQGSLAMRRTVNDASIGGSAFRNATGNIGVNVASGADNLQSNSLSIAYTRGVAGAAD